MPNEAPPTQPPVDEKNEECSVDEVTELVKAIKFAHPSYGIRKVHREIVDTAAVKEPRLSEVKLGQVKKVWKKLGLSEHAQDKNNNNEEILKFYTVGNNSVDSILQSYKDAAEALKEAEDLKEQETAADDSGKWVAIWLDVPVFLDGSKPYQALTNFNNKAEKNSSSTVSADGTEVVKIQVPSEGPSELLPGGKDMPGCPLLLYNQNRSAKTFIHPPSDKEDSDVYQTVRDMIVNSGSTGVLGSHGGLKGYFRARVYKKKKIVSVDVSKMVNPENW